ncbi:MAG: carbohydrate ABC transporter permease [Anaerolineales bacterium]|nr:carbohydrate ABC transporter permease [Anaerolineales bacterium]
MQNKSQHQNGQRSKKKSSGGYFRSKHIQELVRKWLTLLVLFLGAVFIITPFLYMVGTSVKDAEQLKIVPPPILPYKFNSVTIDGKIRMIYEVNIDGTKQTMALIKKAPGGMGFFADPENPDEQYELVIKEQQQLRHLDFNWQNYEEALTSQPFLVYLKNTCIITFVGMVAVIFSSSLVASGFSRFRGKWIDILFIILLSTIMLPGQVRLIPMFVFFNKIGWVDTLYPLIVPLFFASAYDVFLLRQFFLTIPIEMDEAAKIDGASRLQTFFHVILPQSGPALFSVGILHFMYSWNDFYEPLIYLHSQKNWTIAVGLQTFNAIYTQNTHLIMAASVVLVIPPIVLFLMSQRIFVQGVVISGVKG